ncbi:MAG: IPT/TIG domain-containing protein [Dehalococcoidaceae bacterium]|nr:IPT/TIG domain-containing protein [Dehalococcoidaceae bacterium]
MQNRTLFKPALAVFALVIISLLIPTVTVSAAPQVVLEPDTGEVGTEVTVLGINLPVSASIDIYFSSQNVSLTSAKNIGASVTRYKKVLTVNTSSLGFFEGSFDVPESLDIHSGGSETVFHDGPYYVYVTETESTLILAKTLFTMTGFASAEIGASSGYVDDKVSIAGTGYMPGEDISVKFRDNDITQDYIAGSTRVNSSGQFSILMTVPNSPYGLHTVSVQSSLTQITTSFFYQVLPTIKLDKASAMAGQQVYITGTGFGTSKGVVFTLGAQQVNVEWITGENARTTAGGNFVVSFAVPDIEEGQRYIVATDVTNNQISAQQEFTVLPPPLNPAISLAPVSGQVGETIEISGLEFNKLKAITLTIDGVALQPKTAITTTSAGTFNGSFIIPPLSGGSHTVKATDGEVEASAGFNVIQQIDVAPLSGKAGTVVEVTGSGLQAGKPVTVYFNSVFLTTDPAGAKVGADGSLDLTFTVPAVATGTHRLEVRVDNLILVEEFTTSAEVILSSQSSSVGKQVIAQTSGFAPSSPMLITFGGEQMPVVNTDSAGMANVAVIIPHVQEGTYELKIEVAGTVVTHNITIVAQAGLAPASAPVGGSINITGSGFWPNKALLLEWDSAPIDGLAQIQTNGDGAFNVFFEIPVDAPGQHQINISDGVISKNLVFTVEETVPPVPAPVSPETQARLKGPVSFKWQPVVYEYMDVTYELQIIRYNPDSGAVEPIIVLGKPSLDGTEYTLQAGEKLATTGEGDSYFWRVRAVDEAGNTSSWSAESQFYYGFSWPVWATWLLVGLGVVIIGALVYVFRWRIAELFY